MGRLQAEDLCSPDQAGVLGLKLSPLGLCLTHPVIRGTLSEIPRWGGKWSDDGAGVLLRELVPGWRHPCGRSFRWNDHSGFDGSRAGKSPEWGSSDSPLVWHHSESRRIRSP